MSGCAAKAKSHEASSGAKAANRAEPAAAESVANAAWARVAFGIQTRLAVSQPDDPYEREADSVADQVMRMADSSVSQVAPPSIQMKCKCGGESNCGCDEKLQTKRTSGGAGPGATYDTDAAVRAARGIGTPLPANVRSYYEPRFGRDFSGVRVHTGGEAANSARGLHARAFTLGSDIVFGSGHYAPHTGDGQRLLAHELTHVVQQGRAAPGERSDSMSVTSSPARVARDKDPYIELEIDPDPNCPPDMICVIITNGPKQHTALSAADKAAITQATGAAAPPGTLTFSKDGPRFVLHDTATSFGVPTTEAKHLSELKTKGSTPVGEGPSSYVTAAGAPFQAHSKFFNAQRPTATEFERGNDLMDLLNREKNMQLIWSFTDPTQQDAAIAAYLALYSGLSAKDITAETAKAKKNLDSAQTTPDGKGAKVFTTAGGAVSQICDAVAAKGAKAVAVAGQDAALDAACKVMRPVFAARSTRVAESTNVEIIADQGTDCDASAAAAPFTAYAPAAYDAVANLYLKAALEAGQFPEITTHYFLDSTTPAGSPGRVTKSQNRCDPRCFDLDLLYSKIGALLGHGKGSTYGVPAIYGTTWGTSTVWWPQQVCGTGRGTPAPAAPKTKTKQQVPKSKTSSTSSSTSTKTPAKE